MRLIRLSALLLFLLPVPVAQASPPGLAPVPPSAARWDFGTRAATDDSPLVHAFQLRNSAKSPVTIARVAVSCDCVEAEVGESGSLPATVAPGQTIPVTVTVSVRRFAAGSVSRSVWLYPGGLHTAPIHLEIVGTVRDDPASSR